jgi:hypothetical protein
LRWSVPLPDVVLNGDVEERGVFAPFRVFMLFVVIGIQWSVASGQWSDLRTVLLSQTLTGY